MKKVILILITPICFSSYGANTLITEKVDLQPTQQNVSKTMDTTTAGRISSKSKIKKALNFKEVNILGRLITFVA